MNKRPKVVRMYVTYYRQEHTILPISAQSSSSRYDVKDMSSSQDASTIRLFLKEHRVGNDSLNHRVSSAENRKEIVSMNIL